MTCTSVNPRLHMHTHGTLKTKPKLKPPFIFNSCVGKPRNTAGWKELGDRVCVGFLHDHTLKLARQTLP